jgi:MFS family permease
MSLMQRIAPESDLPNVRAFYLMNMADSAAFISGNWIFYWTLFMSFSQLGLNDSLAFAFGLFMEIPTGALADLVGRRWTVSAAMLFNGAGFLIMGAAGSWIGLFGGFLLFQIGLALYSGASEAFAYDSLKDAGRESAWEKVASASHSLSMLAFISATIIGAIIFNWNARLPHLLWGVVFLVGFLTFFSTREPTFGRATGRITLGRYARQLVVGTRQLGVPGLRPFVPLMIGLAGIFFVYSWGIVQPAVALNFGLNADAQATYMAVVYTIVAIVARFLPRLRARFGDIRGLSVLNVLILVALLGMLLPLGPWGAGLMLLMTLNGSLSRTWLSIVVNQHTPSSMRATTISAMAFIVKLPYVLAGMLAGIMIDAGMLNQFLLGMAGLSALLLVLAHILARRKTPQPVIAPAGD